MEKENGSYLLNTKESLEKEKERLVKQATMFFSLEEPIIKRILTPISSTNILLDLGCGNGFYTSNISNSIKSHSVFGYERNLELIKEAEKFNPTIQIKLGDLSNQEQLINFIAEVKPDVVNLRFVLQHMSNEKCMDLLKTLYKNIKLNTKVLITEPNDTNITFSPESLDLQFFINRTMKIQEERGGDRTIAGKMLDYLATVGFENIRSEKYLLSETTIGIDGFIETIIPVWRSYRKEESKTELDKKIDLAIISVKKHFAEKTFKFTMPVYIFAASKQAFEK